jgi:hypothetical protein
MALNLTLKEAMDLESEKKGMTKHLGVIVATENKQTTQTSIKLAGFEPVWEKQA